MENEKQNQLFHEYYMDWISVYKEGAIRKVTMDKYRLTQSWVKKLAPDLRMEQLNRLTYQKLLNDFAAIHEKQTTMDFHHQLKAAILDAVDDGLIGKDPTRKVVIKGKRSRKKKQKFLSQNELQRLLSVLDLRPDAVTLDWLIMLIAKTGMRFSEAIALTPSDFDFAHQMVSVNKTWDYKNNTGFAPTKNKSSVRKIQIDWKTASQFAALLKDKEESYPFFINPDSKIYNATANEFLYRKCRKAGIKEISIHGLRHTHASLLLFSGVTIASVARRLGHSSMTTTQKTYLHIIQELENKDIDLVMRAMSNLI